ncbi:MAG: hypothetical protein WAU68_11645, partial [Vitreimonas sp.]
YVGNNGTANISDTDSVKERTVSQGTGAYRDGATTPSSYSDYDGSYNSLNSFNQGSSASSWTVQAGETLQGIAAQLWGDSNLWYKIAEINGLTVLPRYLAGGARCERRAISTARQSQLMGGHRRIDILQYALSSSAVRQRLSFHGIAFL